MVNRGPVWSRHGVEEQGLGEAGTVHWNLPPARLYEEAVKRGEAAISADGALICHTGEFTGRSPNDKFVVEEPGSSGEVWWGKVNKPISPAHFDALLAKARRHLAGRAAAPGTTDALSSGADRRPDGPAAATGAPRRPAGRPRFRSRM